MNKIIIYLRSMHRLQIFILACAAIGAFTVTYVSTTSADCYGGEILGRGCYRGYFTNIDDRGGDNVLPIIRNGQAIPSSDINNADQLYNLLISSYNSGDAQKRTGSAFIFNTMMGNTAPGIGKNITNAQWDDFYLRLKSLDDAGKVSWGGNVSSSINSFWQGTNSGFSPDGFTDDAAFYGEFKNEPGILIRDYDNNVIYELLRRCANPVGDPQGLPEALNYELTPYVNSISPTTIEAGSKVSVSTSVNTEGDTDSRPTQWEITQINVSPGKKAPHEDEPATISGVAPCQSNGGAASGNYFQSGDASCKNVAKGSGVFSLGTPSQSLKPLADGISVGDLPTGTRVCFTLSVQPRAGNDINWAHSKPICTVVGKKPKVQIWGGDIAVRGKIDTSTTVKDVAGGTKTFGSWVEYGAFSVGLNSRFASGSGTNDQSSNDQLDWSRLTFANKDQFGATIFGRYATGTNFRSIPNAATFFRSIQDTQPIGATSVDITSLAFSNAGAVRTRTAGDVTITGGSLSPGSSVIIVAEGTVTIDGNIVYSDTGLTNIKDIPQIVIVARDINIKDSVSRIDAWLVAGGTINTCSNLAGSLTSAKCANLLEVNGPVITNRLLLNRTAGSETGDQSGAPAEKFNLRPDAYLWAQLRSQGDSKAQTVYSSELPARF